MKRFLLIFVSILTAASCGHGGHGKRVISGDAGAMEGARIYMYEYTGYYNNVAVDSADIVRGRFRFEPSDKIADGLVFIGVRPDRGDYVFLDGRRMVIEAREGEDGSVEWKVEGSPGDKDYREFLEKQYVVTERRSRDSINALFYKAHDAGDMDEVIRLKEESSEYYQRGAIKEQQLVKEIVAEHRDDPFGAYLYYDYIFRRTNFPTPESVRQEREYLQGFGPRAQASASFARMEQALNRYEGCAIGAAAPEITGVDSLGNRVRLSDFRGNYTIVDFWTSYCHWCRQETPYLLKAMEKFKDKNFRILGVSSDNDRNKWIEAIREDGTNWDHMILPAGDKTLDTYCVKGIPHLILIGPDGRILAKDLRWDDHITVTQGFMDTADS